MALKSILTAAAVCLAAASTPAQADTLALGGTGAGLETLRLLGNAFAQTRASLTVEVAPSLGSGGGIQAVAERALNVSISARELSAAERTRQVVQIPFGHTAFVVLSSHRGIKDIARAEIGAIVAGTMSKWSDGTPIRIILRPDDDTDLLVFHTYFPEFAPALKALRLRRELPVAATDQDNFELAEQMAGSFALGTYAQIVSEKRKLTALSIDGVAPTPDNVVNRRYRYAKTFHLAARSDPSALTRDFLAFVAGPEGRRILEANGWAPERAN